MFSSPLLQNLIVATIVLTALVLLALRATKALRGKKGSVGCGLGCGGCAKEPSVAQAASQLLQLQTAKRDGQ